MKRFQFKALGVFWVILGCSLILAQSQTTGTLEGSVSDPDGSPLPGVVVTLTNTETQFKREVVTNGQGRFRGLQLPLGRYSVRAILSGFKTTTQDGLRVTVARPVVVGLVMQPATVSETMMVMGSRPVVETTRTELSTQIDERSVQALPNNGRNFLDFLNLTPGVGIVQGPDGDEITINGQKGIQNNIAVDGADFNNPFFGEQRGGQRPPFTFNLDAVEEIVVLAEGAPAEFGRASGGFVNVITKSGTNTVQGSAHIFFKNDGMATDAVKRDGTEEEDLSDDQHQIGFTVGGPIIKDKLFYFVTADSQRRRTTKQTLLERIDERLVDYFESIGSPMENGPIERTDDVLVALAKLDWNINQANLLTLRFSFTDSEQENGTFDVDSWGRSANALEQDESFAITGTLISTLSDSVLNEFRFQWARENRPRPYNGPQVNGRPLPDTAIDFDGGYRFGMPFFIPVDYHDTRLQFNNNTTFILENHTIKAGIEFNQTRAFQTFIGFANGRYIFSSVEGFLNYVDNPNYVECSDGSRSFDGTCPEGANIEGPLMLYLQQAGVGDRTVEEAGTQTIDVIEPAIFIQDKWEPRSNLAIQYGLRYEAELRPGPITPADEVFFAPFIGQTRFGQEFPSDGNIPDDTDMWQPRLGISWDPADDGLSVIRLNAGVFYARLTGLVLAQPRSTNGSVGQSLFRASFTGGAPTYPDLIPQEEVGDPFFPNVFVFDRNFKNPRTTQGSIAYERQVLGDYAILFKFTYAETKNLTRFVNRNDPLLGDGTTGPWSSGLGADGTNGLGTLTVVESSARSEYTGYNLTITKRWTHNYQFQVNYTYSEDKSDDDNERDPFTFRYARVTDLDAEWGYSDRHQPHRVNAWVLWQAPGEININARYSYRSAQPLSLTETGEIADTPQRRINADGSIMARNTGTKDNKFSSLDLRISRLFRLRGFMVEPVLEVFNLLNSENFLSPEVTNLIFNFDGTVQSGSGSPRQYQVGVKAKW